MNAPSVTVAIPVYEEEQHLGATLEAIATQTYEHVQEILVVDGGSTDRTVEIAESFPGVRVLEQPGRQAAALNAALHEAKGDVFVRVDGHCTLEPDYVARCVHALVRTDAAMVGGAMRPVGEGWQQRGISAAMTSRLGHGPARFHVGGPAGWTDAVYLGAYRRELALEVGGYDEGDCNEDAEFAIRMRRHGGIWFDPSIRSTYVPRDSLSALARQFYLYGRARSLTV
ncbi:MAG: glycosyltransferase family 2 protein, partial [Acidimicrobiia bacterium]